MASVNEWLVEKGYGPYVWAFASQGFEGPKCMAELQELSPVELDQIAINVIQQAEEALGHTGPAPAGETVFLNSATPGLRVVVDQTRNVNQSFGKSFTQYSVSVYTVEQKLAVQSWKRYSDFDELRKEVSKVPAPTDSLPRFPPKVAAGGKKDSVVQDRMTHLRIYVDRLLTTCPSAARVHLDDFLCLNNVEDPHTPAPREAAPVRKVSARIERLADYLGYEEAQLDEVMDMYDNDKHDVIQFLRDQIGEDDLAVDSHGTSSDEEDEPDDLLARARSAKELEETTYDATRSRSQMQVIHIIDESDGIATLNAPMELDDGYFSASAEFRYVDDGATADSDVEASGAMRAAARATGNDYERDYFRSNMNAMGFEEYVGTFAENNVDSLSEWAAMDEESWPEMLDALNVDPQHHEQILGWLHNPEQVEADPLSISLEGMASFDSVDFVPDSPARPKNPLGDIGDAPVHVSDASRFRRIRRPPLIQGNEWNDIMALTQKYTIPDICRPQRLRPERDRGLGTGFSPGSALPWPTSDTKLQLHGSASGPQFAIIFTEDGATHAWSKGGAAEMRASCGNPWALHSPEADNKGRRAGGWGVAHAKQQHLMDARHEVGYKLISNSHSKTIGPNMNNCLSTLLESCSHEDDIYQIVNGIVKEEEYKAAMALRASATQAVMAPSGGGGGGRGRASSRAPHCSMSGISLASPLEGDGSTAAVALSSRNSIRKSFLDQVVGWKLPPNAQIPTEPPCFDGMAPELKDEMIESVREMQQLSEAEQSENDHEDAGAAAHAEVQDSYGLDAVEVDQIAAYVRECGEADLGGGVEQQPQGSAEVSARQVVRAIRSLEVLEDSEDELHEDRELELSSEIEILRQEWAAPETAELPQEEKQALAEAIRECFENLTAGKQQHALAKCGFKMKLLHTMDQFRWEIEEFLASPSNLGGDGGVAAGGVAAGLGRPAAIMVQAAEPPQLLHGQGPAGDDPNAAYAPTMDTLKTAFSDLEDGSFVSEKYTLLVMPPEDEEFVLEGSIAQQTSTTFAEADDAMRALIDAMS